MNIISENLFEIFNFNILLTNIENNYILTENNIQIPINTVYNIITDPDTNLCIIYPFNYDNKYVDKIFTSISSIIAIKITENDTLTIKPITYFRRILYKNDSAIKYIMSLDQESIDKWNNLLITQSFDGPVIQIYYNPVIDKWNISSEFSIKIDDKLADIFTDIQNNSIDNLISNNSLDKKLCYKFILLHHKYKNIIKYNNYGNNYKEIILQDVSQNGYYTEHINNIDNLNKLIDKFNIIVKPEYHFTCYKEFKTTLDKINYDNIIYKKISTEGFYIIDKNNNINMKIQTNMYIHIKNLKSQYENNYKLCLSLYQKDKLTETIPYISAYSNEIIYRINMSIKTLSKEFLNLYHITRHKNNKEIYELLTHQYKKTLYGIHGIYINKRKSDFSNKSENISNFETKSITVHDIYYYIKSLPYKQLLDVYYDRIELMKIDKIVSYLNPHCIYTLMQSKLMFNL
jgi:hypothetical protein